MYIIASFEHSAYLEMGIGRLESTGIKSENIFAVPLAKKARPEKLFDTINQSDGISLVDLAFVVGTFCAILGSIYGFLLKWGPILWGIIGFFIGAAAGLAIDFIPKKNKNNKKWMKQPDITQVFLMIKCDRSQAESVEKILSDNMAFGIAKFEKPDPSGLI